MLIEKLFKRNIFRPINGVVKADQLDESSVWQELDEFVVTRELDQHLRKFFSAYLDAIDRPNDVDVSGKIGVWVSGFFGSGKSHFIKVLSYLLRNGTHSHAGDTKQAVEFFESKIADAMLFGDIKRALASKVDVILFNIDSKADHRSGRDVILQVFLKVLNEMQGYSPDHPHIAHMERYLDGKGKLPQFHEAYRNAAGAEWKDERDAYEFNRDEVVKALSETLGQTIESAQKWIDNADKNFPLTIENFCKWVKEYLDSRGPDHRILFLADEVGQFIGTDGHLMLNLQTIAENLGTVCEGRAWIIVTSQEALDKVLGELKKTQDMDFSKIQGRFATRLSLSSANVDEVIQSRLLAKDPDVVETTRDLFAEKGDILKHQLTFSNVGMTFRPYKDADDFVKNYPFAPYQFQLVQKIFEAIRKAGATGLHLSRGERSILDAFQSAGKQVAAMQVGILVPAYRFYPSIESFLDTAVKRTIDQAGSNPSLEPFDINVLQVLFLIRYVEEVKGNVDNLVTLCLDEIDADRLALRRRIEESLLRLEKETLINRSGDNYFFLTNEERDISRDIKNVDLTGGEEAKLLGELIFHDVLKDQRKHRYSANKMDFSFNRTCDLHPIGNRTEGGLLVSVVSPLADDYDLYDKGKCAITSTADGGHLLIKLGNDERLGRELRVYLQTKKYIARKDDSTLPESSRRILRDCAGDNHIRRERLVTLLGELLTGAEYFAAGQALPLNPATSAIAIEKSLEYLIQNTFTKMSYLKNVHESDQDCLREIQAVLRANDIQQQSLQLNLPESNPQAIEEVRKYVELCASTSKQVVLYDMIENRFAKRPFGWPQMETALLVARLVVLGEIALVMDGAPLPADKAYDAVTTANKQRKVIVMKRRTTDPRALQEARNLGQQVFSEMGPDGEDALFAFLQAKLTGWRSKLSGYKPLADTGDYPGGDEIREALTHINKLLADTDSFKFIERFNALKSDLLDLADSFRDLEHFYEHQKPTWEKLRKAADRFNLNRMELERDERAAPALKRMEEILSAPSPYGIIKEAEDLITTVEAVNAALVERRRGEALASIDGRIATITKDVQAAGGDAALKTACLQPLERLHGQVVKQESLAHITQAEAEAVLEFDAAVRRIEEFVNQKDKGGGGGGGKPPVVKPQRVIRPAQLVTKPYLETQDDINGFLSELRQQLEQAVADNQRVQIR